ncbi:hypothetical protein NVP1261O_04 [Vibrio phage 1.261.O._10N.286.51.A7]|uniref:Uncharacterized protein n=1 Tax=Vibrio phage 1.261.O._10N.286.51.A7 TaxID=1881237 RepID=A0A2I7RZC4_9CAUD|nr:hypothetical protein HOU80_gp04 [Vibrio phage 1.261.O._10N.286.51.A7]AUR99008.1 hypothetical protein NVP1261O_04 [Vibrio phage 1.261.O._10N.286.51.A7]
MITWHEFKDLVEEQLLDSGIDPKEAQIEWIDFGGTDHPEVTVSQGSDGRIEIEIGDS